MRAHSVLGWGLIPFFALSRYPTYLIHSTDHTLMEVLEKLRGLGRLLLGDEVALANVPYQITIWRHQSGSDPLIDGRLDVPYASAIAFMDSPILLSLELEDRRTLYLRMTSTTGRVISADRDD